MKVVIADAHSLFRCLLKFWIQSEIQIQMVADTGLGSEVLGLVQEHKPDLLLMDPFFPDKSGFDIARELVESVPALKIVALYPQGRPFIVDQIQRFGFHGSVCKDVSSMAVIRDAIHTVAQGNAYFCSYTCRVQNNIYNSGQSFARREQQILSYIGAGMDNESIGAQLVLSPATVQTHRRNLFRKLEIHDTPSLMRYAIEQGFWIPGDVH